jgi:hypothetical protein
MERNYDNEIGAIQQGYKQNKDKVIDFLIENIMNVDIELPENIKKNNRNKIKK